MARRRPSAPRPPPPRRRHRRVRHPRAHRRFTEVLRGERQVALRTEAPKSAKSRTRSARSSGSKQKADSVALDAAGEGRFERLREWRAATAKDAGLPAYVIFHDATLRQVAAEAPTSLDALAGVSGIGAGKLDKWGTALLEVVAAA